MTSVYETIERPLVQVLADMEQAGVSVDPDQPRTLSRDFGARMAENERDAYAPVGPSFNIGSPNPISAILFGEPSVAGGDKADTGALARQRVVAGKCLGGSGDRGGRRDINKTNKN